jgi:hypothetical protein
VGEDMIHGNPETVYRMVRFAFYTAVEFVWDVRYEGCESAATARERLGDIVVEAMTKVVLPVEKVEEPMYGTFPIANVISSLVDAFSAIYVEQGYMEIRSKRRKALISVFKEKLEAEFMLVPRTKKDMMEKNPSLYPPKKTRRKK